MSYRSTDKDFMDQLKKNVLSVTTHQDKEQRKYALDYLRTHVRIDDLHQLAIKEFPKKTIVFGEGPYNPLLVVVTTNPITADQKQPLEKAWSKLGVPPEEVYYAHLRFVSTKKKQDKRQDILNKLIHILSPKALFAFDVSVDTALPLVSVPYSIQTLVDSDTVDARKEITQKLKELRQIILN